MCSKTWKSPISFNFYLDNRVTLSKGNQEHKEKGHELNDFFHYVREHGDQKVKWLKNSEKIYHLYQAHEYTHAKNNSHLLCDFLADYV